MQIIPARILLLLLFPLLVFGQPAQAPLNPPWMGHSRNFLMVLFHLDHGQVQRLLPDGVQAKANAEGKVLAGFEVYATDRVHGLPNYTAAFIFVEISGRDSANGTPGHWAIWGHVNEPVAAASFQRHYGLPFTYEPGLTVEADGGSYSGVARAAGKEVVRLKVTAAADQPFRGEGIVNMVAKSPAGDIVHAEVPWFSTGSSASVVTFAIIPRGDPALEVVKGATPFWAVISTDQTFSYSRPVPK